MHRSMPGNPATYVHVSPVTSISNSYFNQNVPVPMELPNRKKKKPFLTTYKEFTRKKAKSDSEPPSNGLLVPELVPVALDTLNARATLLTGLHKLLKVISIKKCRFCPAIHVGPIGHQIASCLGPHNGVRHGRHDWTNGSIQDVVPPINTFHLFDRLAKPIMHENRWNIPRVPAIVELCIQAGVDIPLYPTKRRTEPVVVIDNEIVDFDAKEKHKSGNVGKCKIIKPTKFNEKHLYLKGSFDDLEVCALDAKNLAVLAEKTMQAWFLMRDGAKKLMSKYMVYVCGYCQQVHVGPKGAKTSECKGYKNYQRSGRHGWQEATIDDLIPPGYVWHVQDCRGPPLPTELRVFFGAAPAVIELCVQAGAAIPEDYKAMMRLDVVVPDLSELNKVV
ncbi:hypothetical protein KP509_20G080200 [Ceratopteris richardii]|uniref:APO domain-containing protein n=1 Tax=Ceratopteris richardii TaxID=49495 RepID=A0A8T2SGN7_CERRI|nr:hypothetical protein KP509_20G080200 [Ceratopteris richardii]